MTTLPIRSLALIVRTLEGGGMQRIILLLAEAFAKTGIRVEILTGHYAETTFKLPPGASVRCLPRSNVLSSSLGGCPRIAIVARASLVELDFSII
jgi:hypothetical protein